MKSEVEGRLKIFWAEKGDKLPEQTVVAENEIFIQKRRKNDGTHLTMVTCHNRSTHETVLSGRKRTLKEALAAIYNAGILARVAALLDQHLDGINYDFSEIKS